MDAPTITPIRSYSTHQDYYVHFSEEHFTVTVTTDSSVISRWIHDVIYAHNRFSPHPLIVGVAVQWSPNHYTAGPPPRSYFNAGPPPESNINPDHPADTLQLCVGNECLIIQLRYCNQVPNDLRTFLTDRRTKYVGVWNHEDAGKLARSIHRLEIGELLDIKEHVYDSEGRSGRSSSFGEIVEVSLGYPGMGLDRNISMSDWSGPYLDDAQILQASLKVYICHKLGVLVRLWEV